MNERQIKSIEFSFTGFASFSPNQDASFQYPNISPDTAAVDGTQVADATVVPKPKKFFKSRNSVPDPDVASVAALAESPVAITALSANASATALTHAQPQHPTTSKFGNKTSKKNSGGATKKTKSVKAEKTEKAEKAEKNEKAEKAEKVEKPPRPEKKVKVKKRTKAEENPTKVVPEVKPTRVLSRTRKAVNYSEDKSRSPSPKRQAITVPPTPLTLPSAQNDLETSPIHQPQFNSDSEPIESQAINQLKAATSPPSTSKNLTSDHPPIVLRISKVIIRTSI